MVEDNQIIISVGHFDKNDESILFYIMKEIGKLGGFLNQGACLGIEFAVLGDI